MDHITPPGPPAGSDPPANHGAGQASNPQSPIANPQFQRRLYQTIALAAARERRLLGLFWTRRGRKSTTLGDIAFDDLSKGPGRTVIAASASLVLGTELAAMTTTAAERAILVGREAMAFRTALENANAARSATAGAEPLDLKIADTSTDKILRGLDGDDFSDLYAAGRMEVRLYFDRANYSRVRVIAPNPATARGWGGTVLRDEVGFIKNEAEVQQAVNPIIDTDPSFRMIYASNLPKDDRHPWFEMTLPRDPALKFDANPAGHFYRGQTGLTIHRVDLSDAYAAGHRLFDEAGEPMNLEEARASIRTPAERRENYDLIHTYGGAATIDALALHSSQARGAGQCILIYVDSETDFQRGLRFLIDKMGDGVVGIGFDTATTTAQISNPSSVTVTESRGIEKLQRVVFVWKEKNPKIARERVRRIIETIRARPSGGPGRRLCIDASNERYFAQETADELRALIPVELVINSVAVHPAGYEEPTNYKTWLGDLYAAEVNDNHYSLPAEVYLKEDHRLVIKQRGIYQAEPDPKTGAHGDTFDSGKLAQHALNTTHGNVSVTLI